MEGSIFEDHDAASIGRSLSPESIAITEEKLYASDIFRMTCFKVSTNTVGFYVLQLDTPSKIA